MARRKKKSFMTAATLTHLPLAAGGAVLASAGRAALWILSRFMRAPLTNTAIMTMVSLTAMASSNALFLQTHEHPAPLFAPPADRQMTAAPSVMPVVPAVRRGTYQVVAPLPEAVSTGSIAADASPIDNAEVFELQRKLEMLKLFDGTIDGYYGPQTARAIKKFEERNGMKPTGELTAEIVEAVRRAPVIARTPEPRHLPAPEPLPATDALPKVNFQPVAEPAKDPAPLAAVMPNTVTTVEPLPAPDPLPLAVQPRPIAESQPIAQKQPLRRELPETPQEAFNLAVETAGDAIDTIVNGVQTVTMNRPATSRPAAVQQFAPTSTGSIATAEQPTARTATQMASIEPRPVPGQPLVIAEPEPESFAEVPVLDTDAKPEDLMPVFSVTDPVMVARVQRGLGSLGFLHGPADGVAGEATAKAIRNFEVYYNYRVTGRISPELLDLLVQNGATI
jgi:peptidoglycan hydrolase-like protein with peptidoglycan-binding domain